MKIQVFEWELDEVTLHRAEEAIQFVVSTMEAFYDGVDPKVLFRPIPILILGMKQIKWLVVFGSK